MLMAALRNGNWLQEIVSYISKSTPRNKINNALSGSFL
jgi:hypothetical protein